MANTPSTEILRSDSVTFMRARMASRSSSLTLVSAGGHHDFWLGRIEPGKEVEVTLRDVALLYRDHPHDGVGGVEPRSGDIGIALLAGAILTTVAGECR